MSRETKYRGKRLNGSHIPTTADIIKQIILALADKLERMVAWAQKR